MAVDPRKTLGENLEALMRHHWGGQNKRALAKKAGVGETTVHMIFGADNRTRLDVIDRLAGVFKLPAWRLLKPDVMAANPDQPSDTAMDVAEMFDRVPAARQARAYALIVQLLEFENTGPGEEDGLPSETPSPAPAKVSPGKRRAKVRP